MDHTLIESIGILFKTFKQLAKDADNNHAFRYVKLVESSKVGHDCKYAKASLNMWVQSKQKDDTLLLLEQLRDELELAIRLYKEEQRQ